VGTWNKHKGLEDELVLEKGEKTNNSANKYIKYIYIVKGTVDVPLGTNLQGDAGILTGPRPGAFARQQTGFSVLVVMFCAPGARSVTYALARGVTPGAL
jgi:hypothetical protein